MMQTNSYSSLGQSAVEAILKNKFKTSFHAKGSSMFYSGDRLGPLGLLFAKHTVKQTQNGNDLFIWNFYNSKTETNST